MSGAFIQLVTLRCKRAAVEVIEVSDIVAPGRVIGVRFDLKDWQTKRRGWVEFDLDIGTQPGVAAIELIDAEIAAFKRKARHE